MDPFRNLQKAILAALSHPEAEEGLYLDNLRVVHEDEERSRVEGSEQEVLDVLQALIEQGKVFTEDSERGVIFKLAR